MFINTIALGIGLVLFPVKALPAAPPAIHPTITIAPIKVYDQTSWTDQGQLLVTPIPSTPAHPWSPAVLCDPKGTRRQVPPFHSLSRLGSRHGARKILPFTPVLLPNGQIYCQTAEFWDEVVDKHSVRKTCISYYKFDTHTWEWPETPTSTLQPETLINAVLLSDDYLLGIATQPNALEGPKGRFHLFSIYKRNIKGEFIFDRYEEAGLGDGPLVKNGRWGYPLLEKLWLFNRVAWSRHHTLVGTGSGQFWCFDVKGRMIKFFNLFSFMDETFLKKENPWPFAILGMQPNREGNFLISSIGEDGLRRGMLAFLDEQPSFSSEHYQTKVQEHFTKILAVGQVIQWYFLDPDNRTFYETAAPQNIPNNLITLDHYRDFNWTFKPDGNLQFFQQRRIPLPRW